MKDDKLFTAYIKSAEHHFSGWDFSYITDTGRMQSELLPWSYGSMAATLVQNCDAFLDMGTGGGEFLSKLRPFPEVAWATEAYPPNVPIAAKRLEPLGVKVAQVEDDTTLPFDDNQFDVIINRHESYSPKEVRRIIKDGSIFLTQQVGGTDCIQINEALGVPANDEFAHWNLHFAAEELLQNGFKITYSNESYPAQRFYDIGALIYYLKAIPWQLEDFSVEKSLEKLYEIHTQIQSNGYFDVRQDRFVIKAEAI
ncbi:class I SAM-dependent methyltransferase [Fictibacillus aquaticus]|uniref:SAM-dependent methyltransferase n=1 Tax=Fictibacillus aquaticus TaxID=2021314 RepID=A0A235F5R8_9BACL|nr:class I SAM-dependent methyltransferase [Fictibacillus aquaticus]OYD56646.1 SAM-dependent methyltransferase [Fictibacillus aquaticus]